HCFLILLTHPPPGSTLFPYTTLFRSADVPRVIGAVARLDPLHSPTAQLRVERPRSLHVAGVQLDVDDWLRSVPHTNQTSETAGRSEEHTSELQSPCNLVCRLLLEKKK